MELNELAVLLVDLFGDKANLSIANIWLKMGATITDIVKAYGIMMKKCDRPSFPYMSKIIMNWMEEREVEHEYSNQGN